MVYWLIFLSEIILLFICSREFIKSLHSLFFFLTKNKTFANYMVFFIFLPGIALHEFSHAAVAYILRVYVGRMELVPKLESGNLTLGSVEIGKTDILRRMLIGVAPFLTGMSLLIFVPLLLHSKNFLQGISYFQIFLSLFFIFQITNTMFSSKKDLEGIGAFLMSVFFILVLLYIFQIPLVEPVLHKLLSENFLSFIISSSIILFVPLLFVFLLSLSVKFLLKIK